MSGFNGGVDWLASFIPGHDGVEGDGICSLFEAGPSSLTSLGSFFFPGVSLNSMSLSVSASGFLVLVVVDFDLLLLFIEL